jgi:hypothetical protein
MITREYVYAAFAEVDAKIAAAKAAKAKPKLEVKPEVKAEVVDGNWERKPEIVFGLAADQNEAAIQLAREQQWRAEEATRARAQAELDRWWATIQEAERERRALRQVGGSWRALRGTTAQSPGSNVSRRRG